MRRAGSRPGGSRDHALVAALACEADALVDQGGVRCPCARPRLTTSTGVGRWWCLFYAEDGTHGFASTQRSRRFLGRRRDAPRSRHDAATRRFEAFVVGVLIGVKDAGARTTQPRSPGGADARRRRKDAGRHRGCAAWSVMTERGGAESSAVTFESMSDTASTVLASSAENGFLSLVVSARSVSVRRSRRTPARPVSRSWNLARMRLNSRSSPGIATQIGTSVAGRWPLEEDPHLRQRVRALQVASPSAPIFAVQKRLNARTAATGSAVSD